MFAQGSLSEVEALRVGAYIEELDINDLLYALEQTDHRDLERVYTNLLKGSGNHLRVFVGRLETLGETYDAQVLSPEQMDEVLAEASDKGHRGRPKHALI